MGNYLTVVNNTPYTWKCKLSGDDNAINLGYGVAAGAAVLAGIIGVVGCYLPYWMGITADQTALVWGMSAPNFLRTVFTVEASGFILSGISTVGGFSDMVVRALEDELLKHQYINISSNELHTWTKVTPLVWRQSTCARVYEVNATDVRAETIVMRPLFSGHTYSIMTWIRKGKVKIEDVVAVDPIVPPNKTDEESVLLAANGLGTAHVYFNESASQRS
uniref:Uncharacterized protein AlNc14C23G2352 n=1 Tax=Albugo laibachii Nc14 TaxID=890382 RepID=F0W652_9STRA|nr:conserved hypothetical protein [Albugo laibachii Nc14]|eukprot:CCA16594.1 conserved hypothetical protein [Albugo laibachii Nc14]